LTSTGRENTGSGKENMIRTGKIIDIDCQCGFRLFRYFKAGKGRLIKCLISRLSEDRVGLTGAATFSRPVCPACGRELGIVMMIHGEPALKLNQGTIKSVRI
jgi:hypothetical protein